VTGALATAPASADPPTATNPLVERSWAGPRGLQRRRAIPPTTACTRLAAATVSASPTDAPVTRFTANARPASNGISTRYRRDGADNRNHSTPTPAAGHTNASAVPSSRVARPSNPAATNSTAHPSVRRHPQVPRPLNAFLRLLPKHMTRSASEHAT
jgi:hypothetical protein